jgi:DNA polymerase III alpha subunit
MIALFKSTYSIGKSILTLDHPSEVKEGGADSIIAIAKENNLPAIFLVEDSMIGFLEAHQKCKEHNIQLVFGLRISCCNNVSDEDKKSSEHKIVLFAKNDAGVKDLTRIFSITNQNHNGFVDSITLHEKWTENLMLCVPFYDSFIYNNNFKGKQCLPNFSFTKVIYFVEDNDLPFDHILKSKVEKWISFQGGEIQKTKSIYYKNRKDFEAWQTYKCLCNRAFGKEQSLSSPNLEHCGSDSFSWEAFKNER